jgi:hypothetical protein
LSAGIHYNHTRAPAWLIVVRLQSNWPVHKSPSPSPNTDSTGQNHLRDRSNSPPIKVEPCSSLKQIAVSSIPPTEYSDPNLVEEMIKIGASQPAYRVDLDQYDSDSDSEFIEQMIKAEASQSALIST